MTSSVLHGLRVLTLSPDGPVIARESDAMDVIGDALGYEADVVAVPVARLSPEFFRLRSGVAGAVVQKFVTYRLHLVVVGDVEHHGPTTGPVADWVREANRGREVWFVADDAELGRRLAARSSSSSGLHVASRAASGSET